MAPLRSDRCQNAYPEALRAMEDAQVRLRRARAAGDADEPRVGFALSGGGIRSATFCIGLFQALARHGLVRRIDLLSTVSGGGYFGSFLGSAFSRDGATVDSVEKELGDNHSWSIQWLRDNGRFLSPNGAGDGWIAAAVMLRNWVALHLVMLTFAFLLLGAGIVLRAELCDLLSPSGAWANFERFLWRNRVAGVWWSPWFILPLGALVLIMLPAGLLYWLTQCTPLMSAVRCCGGIFSRKLAAHSSREFVSHTQNFLTDALVAGFIPAVVLLGFALIDSAGQTAYWRWSSGGFEFPAIWTVLTSIGFALFGFATKIYVLIERLLGKARLKITFNVVALAASLLWLLLIAIGISVAACSLAWDGGKVETAAGKLLLIDDPWKLSIGVLIAFALSWVFSRSFAFVNLSSLQQVYAARLRRAYIGATNPHRRASENHSMTDLIVGDDCCLDQYRPQDNGGPLHFINVTVNETLSAKTQIERCDRKGLAMAVGPCGVSVGTTSHALWADDAPQPPHRVLLSALWEDPKRQIRPIGDPNASTPHVLQSTTAATKTTAEQSSPPPVQTVEALSLGRWVAISGAAFTTGLGSRTHLGLSLLLGLANVRLGYWWDGGVAPSERRQTTTPTLLELIGRMFDFILPVQTCLVNEIFARFHGPARRHWYLSDGGHFENTGCYELIRRRVPFIVCSDAGADPDYSFADLANLVRKARTDFGAEIEIIRRAKDADKREPGLRLPSLEDIVHPSVVDIFGSPGDFQPLPGDQTGDSARTCAPPAANPRHAILARIRYFDTSEICWLLLIKPCVGGDEPVDVLQYQRTHPAFPQEPTSDQYFDEAQWESYRKLGEHVGTALFATPDDRDPRWIPSRFAAPEFAVLEPPRELTTADPIASVLSSRPDPVLGKTIPERVRT